MTLQAASSKPEAFDSNLSSQKPSPVDADSHTAGKQTHSVQSADTEASQVAGFYSYPATERHGEYAKHSGRLPADEVKSEAHRTQNIAVLESEDVLDSVHLLGRQEAPHPTELAELDEGSVPELSVAVLVAPVESVPRAFHGEQHTALADNEQTLKDKSEQQTSETKLAYREYEREFTVLVKDVSEDHAALDQLEDSHRDIRPTEESLMQKFEEEPSELALSEKIVGMEDSGESLQSVVKVDDGQTAVEAYHELAVDENVMEAPTEFGQISEAQHDDVCLPETLDIAAQPPVESLVEMEEFLEAQYRADLSAMWKYEGDDRTIEGLDSDEKLAAESDFGLTSEAAYVEEEKSKYESEQVAAAAADSGWMSSASQQEHTTAVYSDDQETAAVQAMSFAVCSDESFTLEVQPVPVLSDLTSSAQVHDVPPQQSVQTDVNATYVVCCVEPRVLELPEEEVEYDPEIPKIDAVELAIESQFGRLAEAAIKLPECEFGIQELTVPDYLGEFVVDLKSPEVVTLDMVEAPTDEPIRREVQPVYLPVQSDVTSTAKIHDVPPHQGVNAAYVVFCVEPRVCELPEEEIVEYSPEIPVIDAVQLQIESEFGHLAQTAIKLPECEFGVHELTIPDFLDEFVVDLESPEIVTLDGIEIPTDILVRLVVERERHGTEGEEVEHERYFTEGEDEEDAESVTLDDWCVIEKELDDGGFDVEPTDDVSAKTYDQVTGDVYEPATLFICDSTTDETSTDYHTSTLSCTSYVACYFDHFNLLI